MEEVKSEALSELRFSHVKVVLKDFPGLAAAMIKAACEALMAAESTLTKYDLITGSYIHICLV